MKKILFPVAIFLLLMACSSNQIGNQHFRFDETPVVLKQVKPIYTGYATRNSIEGLVMLEVEILRDGSIGEILVVKSLLAGPNGLDEAAVNAVKKWKFKPAKLRGRPVKAWVKLPIIFSLEKGVDISNYSYHKSKQNDLASNVAKWRIFGETKKNNEYSIKPCVTKIVKPIYPTFVEKSNVEGYVVLEVEIFEDGKIGAAKVKRSLMSGENGLDKAAIECIKQWEFQPAILNGKPVSSWIILPIYFAKDHLNIDDLEKQKTKLEIGSTSKKIEYDEPPKIKKSVNSVIPEFAQMINLQGYISAELEVFQDGSVGAVDIRSNLFSSETRTEKTFVNNLKKWKYKPAMLDGKPIASWASFSFHLGNSSNLDISDDETKKIEEKQVKNNLNLFGQTSKFVTYDEPPIPIKKFPPKYPKFAKNSGIEGSVLLEVEVFEDGSVGAVEIKKTSMGGENGLGQAAINSVKKWKFQPAKCKGKPVAVWTTFEVNFNLH